MNLTKLIPFLAFAPALMAQTSPPPPATYLNLGSVPAPVRAYLQALGNRLQRPGQERVTLAGTIAGRGGAAQGQLIWEAPGKFRFDRSDKPNRPIIRTPQAGVATPSLTTDENEALESLFDDSVETFLYGFDGKTAHRFLGYRFRLDDGSTPNYKGPWHDVYQTFVPGPTPQSPPRQKRYHFDSGTGLLAQTVYAGATSGSVITTEFSNWTTAAGSVVPGRVVRRENGVPVFTFTVTGASIGPAAADNAFSGN